MLAAQEGSLPRRAKERAHSSVKHQNTRERGMAFLFPVINADRHSHRRYAPKRDILLEVVAGFLWLYLDLPADLTREELNAVATRLVTNVLSNGEERALIAELARIQCKQFCGLANQENLEFLAKRTLSLVRASGAA
jgi:hypothetical protein